MVRIYNRIFLSYKKDSFESVLIRRMNLEPIIQSEVSQNEKNKHCILMYVHGIQKDGTDKPICRAAMKMQTQRTGSWTQREKRVGRNSMETYTLPYVKQIASRNLLCDTGSSAWCSVTTQRSGMGREMGWGFRREGAYVCLWLIHVDVWQKPIQYCKAIILQ